MKCRADYCKGLKVDVTLRSHVTMHKTMHRYLTTLILALAITATCMAGPNGQLATDLATLERMSPDSAVTALQAKLDSAQATGAKNYAAYTQAAESLLSSPEETTHSEQLWMAVLHHMCSSPALSKEAKIRPEILLAEAKKNRIGSRAANIDLMLKNGETTTLSQEAASQRFTLLYFSNPDCEACHLTKERLAKSETVKQLTASKVLKVVAVYPLDDEKLWRATEMPADVVDTWDSTASVEEGELYALPSMPLSYLIDNEMTVIMKNEASLKRMERALRTASQCNADTNGLINELFKH